MANSSSSNNKSSKSSKQYKLNPQAVRRRASSISGCTELPSQPNTPEHICTFIVGETRSKSSSLISSSFFDDDDDDCIKNLARVTVYCDTGTIATGRVLPCTRSVRNLFRKNVTSLDVVERCLKYPEELPTINWQLVSLSDTPKIQDDEVMSINKNLELLDIGIAILRGNREKVVQHIQCLEKIIEADNNKNSDSNNNSNKSLPVEPSTGMELQFSLAAGPMKHVDQCLNDINRMGKLVHCVATSGTGTVFLYGKGGVAFTPNIPKNLYNRFSQLRESKLHASRPSYVSLGSKDRFFVSFNNGEFSFKGPKGLDKELKNLTNSPRSVAFGSTYDTFFIVLHDGSWKYQGRGVPTELEKRLLTSRGGKDGKLSLACVSLGPSGEWFLRTSTGSIGWGGVTEELDDAIHELLDNDRHVNVLDFGENGSYFVSYD